MLWSQLFIPTLRENPAEAEAISHQLLLRAGYIRQLSAGVYSYLALAQRTLAKIAQIVRQEMNAIGGQEMALGALHPAELYQATGRDASDGSLFRLKDRAGRILFLAPAHEEAMTAMARGELRSYKQLPQVWYQIRNTFRDQPHTRSGLLSARQLTTMDSCSFDPDAAGMDAAYEKYFRAFRGIFDRCGLEYIAAGADFMALSEVGEDLIVACETCGYLASHETATSRAHPAEAADPEGDFSPEEFHTPGRKTIVDVAEFTKLPATSQMKSLVMMAGDTPVLALLRGDHQLSETKLAAAMGARDVRPAHPHEMREWLGADAGSLGPVGVKGLRIIADSALQGRRNMIAGANRDDYHLRHVTPGEDFVAEFLDLRKAAAGDSCASCGAPVQIKKAILIGSRTTLGTRYSETMGLHVSNAAGVEAPVHMSSSGITLERILSAIVEQRHDADGMALPASIAPFHVVVTPVNSAEASQRRAAEEIYQTCQALGLDALFDNRDERPGVKFKDADLIGIPFRITVGKKLAEGKVEMVERHGKKLSDVAVSDAPAMIRSRIPQ